MFGKQENVINELGMLCSPPAISITSGKHPRGCGVRLRSESCAHIGLTFTVGVLALGAVCTRSYYYGLLK